MENICQSCGMIIGEGKSQFGTEVDGLYSKDYCVFCYSNGKFNHNINKEQMIDILTPSILEFDKDISIDEIKVVLDENLSKLKRWRS